MGGGDYLAETTGWTRRSSPVQNHVDKLESSQRKTYSGANAPESSQRRTNSGERVRPVRKRLGVSLFVDGLEEQTTYQQIKTTFSKFGKILGVFVQKFRKKQRRSKFGFVRFNHEGDAMAAWRHMNGKLMNGVPMKISKAKYAT